MATRRNVPQPVPLEKTISESQGGPPANLLNSDTRPAVPSDVLVKLLLFTFAMIVVPIGSYFVTVNLIFREPGLLHVLLELLFLFLIETWPGSGNSTYAGAFAAIMANVVLVSYIVVAMKEDQGDQQTTPAGINTIKANADDKKSQ